MEWHGTGAQISNGAFATLIEIAEILREMGETPHRLARILEERRRSQIEICHRLTGTILPERVDTP
ncbi:hypothetical protein EDD75_0347 [Thermodesulfitimonas autotrophica]|uniref:Uncharacterized protein n=1 Tax=Thermodesulfitimonas autotrophica TaxID=1894989 RepID=A0A3N5C058_9THEO|nr:hypothetical protein [Thermodesulfitimonas autotrophica]RPF49531.1 hypothetical protein EDD75_0347 [Thermodesulfitimonas autotrophica]